MEEISTVLRADPQTVHLRTFIRYHWVVCLNRQKALYFLHSIIHDERQLGYRGKNNCRR